MELTTQEIARVCTMYIGAEVQHEEGDYSKLVGVVLDSLCCIHIETGSYGEVNVYRFGKLLLTPLSEITDGHLEQLCKILGCTPHLTYQLMTDLFTVLVNDEMPIEETGITLNMLSIFYLHQFLISRGYDVPLWFGIDHPANGLTAIELGIAIPHQ